MDSLVRILHFRDTVQECKIKYIPALNEAISTTRGDVFLNRVEHYNPICEKVAARVLARRGYKFATCDGLSRVESGYVPCVFYSANSRIEFWDRWPRLADVLGMDI